MTNQAKMTRIGHGEAKILAEAVADALKAVEQRFGVTIEYNGGTYDYSTWKPKIVVKAAGAENVAFKKYGPMFGLSESHYMAEFVSRGRRFQLTGIEPNRPKYPFVAKCLEDGRDYKFQRTILAKLGINGDREAALLRHRDDTNFLESLHS